MSESFNPKPASQRLWRPIVAATGLVLLLCWGGGCEDVALNWGMDPGPKPRPVGRPVGRVVQPSATGPADGGSQGRAKPGQRDGGDPARPTGGAVDPPRPALSLYQVVLLSQAAPAEAPPGLRHVRLQHARAREVGCLLALVYLPSGPSGTDDRYTLVYPTSLEHDLAAEAAELLDVPKPHGGPPAGSMIEVWRWAMGEASDVIDSPGQPEQRLRQLADALMRVIPSAELPRQQRWMAGMVAGELLARRLYDYAGADAVYRQLRETVEPGSYEQMAVVYARGRALVQDGRREQARQCFESVIGQFSPLRGSELFERSRETLAQWDRRR
ncbi:MAG: hypothetical protein HY718_19290 [Planctomycetes bacterium]|nr:hypothetical protein [Planctomycetota bacterium]